MMLPEKPQSLPSNKAGCRLPLMNLALRRIEADLVDCTVARHRPAFLRHAAPRLPLVPREKETCWFIHARGSDPLQINTLVELGGELVFSPKLT